ncbi:polyphenol oxidase family protein [Trueperella bialowiezensis]|uniref:Laccase domain protein yfiH n=1 Tax=Trueperella bialowiezensis TaxID=312285 RepID=A0A448PCF8_9ACTO|nr:polyphenol oxidase family protein [Trueperella bialowiezensis]VEI12596.1 Laccase domain protein yfiH [Trueperella bialowiezensis]
MIDWVDQRIAGMPQGVRVGFTSRRGGVSTGDYAGLNLGFHVGDDPEAVRANRDALQDQIGRELAWMSQVHGNDVAQFGSATRAKTGYLSVGEADAIVVNRGQAAAVMVADCVPLILVRADGTKGAAVHVGRAGFDLAITHRALDVLGTNDVLAFLGPSICGSCYEVSEQLAADIGGRWPGAAVVTTWGTPGVDVAGGVERQLRERGVHNVYRSPICTYESANHYSHRRATHDGVSAGRFIGFVAM